jgi:hypothetical protein
MSRVLLVGVLFLFVCRANAQIEVSKVVGKNSKDYSLGFGAFLKFAYPVSEAGDVSLEGSFIYFPLKADWQNGFGLIILKAGYRYTLNGTGTGFYIEPQAGYNFYEDRENNPDGPFKGAVVGMGTGYLFQPAGIQFDLGLRFESVIYKGGSVQFLALRLSHNFSLKRREE